MVLRSRQGSLCQSPHPEICAAITAWRGVPYECFELRPLQKGEEFREVKAELLRSLQVAQAAVGRAEMARKGRQERAAAPTSDARF